MPEHAHVKRKRGAFTANEPEVHVKPAAGKQARRIRMEARREARRERAPIKAEVNVEPPKQTMQPRSWTLRRRKSRRSAEARPAERVRPRGVVWISWRWVSGTLTASLIILLVGLLSSDAFYVSSVAVGGVNYLTREEVFRFSGISQKHLFWVDAEDVRQQLLSNNNISDVQVRVGWPPQMVQIVIRERDPVLTWEQGDDRVWVDINGKVMYQHQDRPDLLRIVYDPNEPQPAVTIGPDAYIPVEIIHGALLLESRLPRIDVMLYHPVKGLGWRDPRGWMAWFGIGDNMAMKARVYEALVDYSFDRLHFGEIDVSDPDNPVYTVLWEKTNGQ